jgi:hypothetical protein
MSESESMTWLACPDGHLGHYAVAPGKSTGCKSCGRRIRNSQPNRDRAAALTDAAGAPPAEGGPGEISGHAGRLTGLWAAEGQAVSGPDDAAELAPTGAEHDGRPVRWAIGRTAVLAQDGKTWRWTLDDATAAASAELEARRRPVQAGQPAADDWLTRDAEALRIAGLRGDILSALSEIEARPLTGRGREQAAEYRRMLGAADSVNRLDQVAGLLGACPPQQDWTVRAVIAAPRAIAAAPYQARYAVADDGGGIQDAEVIGDGEYDDDDDDDDSGGEYDDQDDAGRPRAGGWLAVIALIVVAVLISRRDRRDDGGERQAPTQGPDDIAASAEAAYDFTPATAGRCEVAVGGPEGPISCEGEAAGIIGGHRLCAGHLHGATDYRRRRHA